MGLNVGEGYDISSDFRIKTAPQLYVIGGDAVIVGSKMLYSFEDFIDVLRKYSPVTLKKREGDHVQARA
jgi:hypothetical protein